MSGGLVKVIVYTPVEASDQIRQFLDAAGQDVGHYDCWSISSDVVERFRPLEGSNPTSGKPGEISAETNVRIEVQCTSDSWPQLVSQLKEIHPYEVPAIEVIPLLYPT